MRRRIIASLLACLFLFGCGADTSEAFSPSASSEGPSLPLVEQGIPVDAGGRLVYIPNGAAEAMAAPEVRLFGNGLLLWSVGEKDAELKRISLEDGTLLRENILPASPGTKLFIGSGEIGLCDRAGGLVTVLGEDLLPRRTYAVPQEGDDWYLDPELDTLYIFHSDRGVAARELASGAVTWLVDKGSHVTPMGNGSGYVLFTYTDRADRRTYARALVLSTATLETLPMDGEISVGARQGDTWLLRGNDPEGLHHLIRDGLLRSFRLKDAQVRLLSHRRHLLVTDSSGQTLTLYDTDGTFLSRCTVPKGGASEPVWSGYWEGYFFTDADSRLLFWDISGAADGEALPMSPPEQARQPRAVPEQALYERAEALSRRFGVEIRIAENCFPDYSHYDADPLTEPFFLRSALDVLEESLGQYPEGFFRQLPRVRIELTGSITAREGADTHPVSAGAFAQNMGGYYLIVADGLLLRPKTLYHEFSHIIDARLEEDRLAREGALFSEEAWMALQPEGFRYAMSYTQIPEETLRSMASGCFLSEYALTFPTEDRAELMAAAMAKDLGALSPGIGEKLRFYADCIRDCFDTEGWPETTLWEQALK